VYILYISVETDQFLYAAAAFRVFQVAIPLFIQQRAIGFFCMYIFLPFRPFYFSLFWVVFALQNYEAQFDKWADRVHHRP
jgi:hypothetical protein